MLLCLSRLLIRLALLPQHFVGETLVLDGASASSILHSSSVQGLLQIAQSKLGIRLYPGTNLFVIADGKGI
jgi:hypothetical protein